MRCIQTYNKNMRAELKFNMLEYLFLGILISLCCDVDLTDSTDNCHEVEVGIANKQLLFPFKWDASELKSVICDKYGTTIGTCRGISVFDCSVEKPFSGLYNMTENANLTQVTLSITQFDENRAGNYCCSKESKKEPTCHCVRKPEPLTPKPVPPTEAPTKPEVTGAQATSTGIQLGLYNWVMILTTCVPFLYHRLWKEIAD